MIHIQEASKLSFSHTCNQQQHINWMLLSLSLHQVHLYHSAESFKYWKNFCHSLYMRSHYNNQHINVCLLNRTGKDTNIFQFDLCIILLYIQWLISIVRVFHLNMFKEHTSQHE